MTSVNQRRTSSTPSEITGMTKKRRNTKLTTEQFDEHIAKLDMGFRTLNSILSSLGPGQRVPIPDQRMVMGDKAFFGRAELASLGKVLYANLNLTKSVFKSGKLSSKKGAGGEVVAKKTKKSNLVYFSDQIIEYIRAARKGNGLAYLAPWLLQNYPNIPASEVLVFCNVDNADTIDVWFQQYGVDTREINLGEVNMDGLLDNLYQYRAGFTSIILSLIHIIVSVNGLKNDDPDYASQYMTDDLWERYFGDGTDTMYTLDQVELTRTLGEVYNGLAGQPSRTEAENKRMAKYDDHIRNGAKSLKTRLIETPMKMSKTGASTYFDDHGYFITGIMKIVSIFTIPAEIVPQNSLIVGNDAEILIQNFTAIQQRLKEISAARGAAIDAAKKQR